MPIFFGYLRTLMGFKIPVYRFPKTYSRFDDDFALLSLHFSRIFPGFEKDGGYNF